MCEQRKDEEKKKRVVRYSIVVVTNNVFVCTRASLQFLCRSLCDMSRMWFVDHVSSLQ